MSATHETIAGVYRPHPASGSGAYADGYPLDAGTAIMFASNEGVLCAESHRQLVGTSQAFQSSLVAGKDTWYGLGDLSGPSAADAAAADADYQRVSWAPAYTRMWGPFEAIGDRLAADGRLLCRRIRGKVWYTTLGATLTTFDVVLTTHASPALISMGQVLSAYHTSTSSAHSSSFTFDFSPDLVVQGRDLLIARAGGANSEGSTRVGVTLLYLWLCVGSISGCTVTDVSALEVPA